MSNFSVSQTCLSDPLRMTTSLVIRPYLFLPNVFLCNLYKDSIISTIETIYFLIYSFLMILYYIVNESKVLQYNAKLYYA